jgi:hypothetical protein
MVEVTSSDLSGQSNGTSLLMDKSFTFAELEESISSPKEEHDT